MKKKIILLVSIFIIALLCFGTYKFINKREIKDIYNSLVYIEAINNNSIISGSGFVYNSDDNKNYIVTNYHVIEGSYTIYVYNMDKKKTKATLINYDEYNDIAVLVIDNKLGLKSVKIGNSSTIKSGDNVFVVGTPLDIKNFGTITGGNVLKIQELDSLNLDFRAIKISAKTDFGNSGGPLLDNKGRVIGMMFLMDKTNNNISYAIPINFVLDTAKSLEKRVSLGAVMTNTSNTQVLNEYGIETPQIEGVIILGVNKNSVLEKHLLIKGDIIVSINGERIKDVKEFREQLYKYKQGDTVQIEYYRNGNYFKTNLEI